MNQQVYSCCHNFVTVTQSNNSKNIPVKFKLSKVAKSGVLYVFTMAFPMSPFFQLFSLKLKGKSVKINNTEWEIKKQLDCSSYIVVYAVICMKEKCNKTYSGETKRMLKFCVANHFGYGRNNTLDKATGENFSLPGHSLLDLSITVIEQIQHCATSVPPLGLPIS